MEKKTIVIECKTKLSLKPDIVLLDITINSRHKEYEKMLELHDQRRRDLISKLVALDFKEEDIKTSEYKLTVIKNSTKDKNIINQRENKEYQQTQGYIIEFDYDIKRLCKILQSIKLTDDAISLTFKFGIKDMKDAEDRLAKKLITLSKNKAQIMCDTAGDELGGLLNIKYTPYERNRYVSGYFVEQELIAANRSNRYYYEEDEQIYPKDIELIDSATITWEIK